MNHEQMNLLRLCEHAAYTARVAADASIEGKLLPYKAAQHIIGLAAQLNALAREILDNHERSKS